MKHLSLIMVALVLGSLNSCAFTNPKNTPLVTGVDKALGGEDKDGWLSIAAIPLALPLGLVDVTIVHPVQVVDDAAQDTWDLLWEHNVQGAAMRSFLFFPRVTLTPIIFTGDWVGRALFDIPPHGEEHIEEKAPLTPNERKRIQSEIERLQKQLADG